MCDLIRLFCKNQEKHEAKVVKKNFATKGKITNFKPIKSIVSAGSSHSYHIDILYAFGYVQPRIFFLCTPTHSLFFVTHLCLLLISCCVAACCCCFCVVQVFCCLNSTTTFWFLLFSLLFQTQGTKHKNNRCFVAECPFPVLGPQKVENRRRSLHNGENVYTFVALAATTETHVLVPIY